MTTTPRTWVVGEVVTAALLNQEIQAQFNSFFGAWTSYTPTWTAASTNPVLGNGTLVGRYLKVGRTVTYDINLTTGSTTTYGSGSYSFAMPATSANAGCTYIGNAHLLQSQRFGGQFLITPNTATGSPSFPDDTLTPITRHTLWNPTVPLTLASGGVIRITGAYETAA